VRHVLIVVGEEELSRDAVDLGLEIAANEHADATVLGVVSLNDRRVVRGGFGPLAYGSGHVLEPGFHDIGLQTAKARAAERGVRCRLELVAGDPYEEINGLARRLPADLIVISRADRIAGHGTRRLVRRLLKEAAVPVLIAGGGKGRRPAAVG
jgi:nucleotide-binding universal stress UspA family protein